MSNRHILFLTIYVKLAYKGVEEVTFSMKLQEFLQKKNKRPADMARDLKLKHSVVLRWVKGLRVPTPENMQKIFAYTNGAVTPNDFFNINEDEFKEK